MEQETKDMIWGGLAIITGLIYILFMTYNEGKKDGIKQANKDKFATTPQIEWEGGFKGVSLRFDEDNNQTIRIFCK